MLKYVVRRLLAAIPVLFGLSVVVFAFVHLLPGDPVSALLGQHATPELREEIRAQMGLDKPLYEQYFIYLGQLAQGDLGKSVINNRPVIEELGRRFPATVELTAGALLFAIGLGIPLGRLAARFPQRWPDAVVTVISLLGISIPMWANGAIVGSAPLCWSRMKLTSTRMNGLSPWSGWPSQAPWPSASSRRSSSSSGVNVSYHSMERSMSEHGRAMWVQRAEPGRRRRVSSLTGVSLRDIDGSSSQ